MGLGILELTALFCSDAIDLGGQVVLGGGPMTDKDGYFIQPTVITSE